MRNQEHSGDNTEELMKDGIINVYKPAGMTSNDVIYKMRSILGIRKLGHTGTLDPLATGILPILINRGTRITEYLDSDFKTYLATMILGITTDTQDITGEIISKSEKSKTDEIDFDDIKNAFSGFSGLIEQIPPMYSAVRVDGRKLYDYVYSGEELPEDFREKIKPRQVYIKELRIVNFTRGEENTAIRFGTYPRVTFEVICSKGTYIRTICQDAGDILGCGATLETLERTTSGAFTKENAFTLDEIREEARKAGILDSDYHSVDKTFHDEIPEALLRFVVGLDFPMENFGEVRVSDEVAGKFIDGWHIRYGECKIIKNPEYEDIVDPKKLRTHLNDPGMNKGSNPGLKYHPEFKKTYKVYREDGLFLGIAVHSDKYHKLVADKIFLRKEELQRKE